MKKDNADSGIGIDGGYNVSRGQKGPYLRKWHLSKLRSEEANHEDIRQRSLPIKGIASSKTQGGHMSGMSEEQPNKSAVGVKWASKGEGLREDIAEGALGPNHTGLTQSKNFWISI